MSKIITWDDLAVYFIQADASLTECLLWMKELGRDMDTLVTEMNKVAKEGLKYGKRV